jgi:hypothetical protein
VFTTWNVNLCYFYSQIGGKGGPLNISPASSPADADSSVSCLSRSGMKKPKTFAQGKANTQSCLFSCVEHLCLSETEDECSTVGKIFMMQL